MPRQCEEISKVQTRAVETGVTLLKTTRCGTVPTKPGDATPPTMFYDIKGNTTTGNKLASGNAPRILFRHDLFIEQLIGWDAKDVHTILCK